MSKLISFEIDNFRVFPAGAYSKVDIKSLTFITGANSSGKSSVFKALLLLQDNWRRNQLKKLDFMDSKHKLGSIDSILNQKDKPLKFRLTYEQGVSVECTFKKTRQGLRLQTFDILGKRGDILRASHKGKDFSVKYLDVVWFDILDAKTNKATVWESEIRKNIDGLSKKKWDDLLKQLDDLTGAQREKIDKKIAQELESLGDLTIELDVDDRSYLASKNKTLYKEKRQVEKKLAKAEANHLSLLKEIEDETRRKEVVALEQEKAQISKKGDKATDEEHKKLLEVEVKLTKYQEERETLQNKIDEQEQELSNLNNQLEGVSADVEDLENDLINDKRERLREKTISLAEIEKDNINQDQRSVIISLFDDHDEEKDQRDKTALFISRRLKSFLDVIFQSITHLPAFRSEQRRIFSINSLKENHQKAIRRFLRLNPAQKSGEDRVDFIGDWLKAFDILYDAIKIEEVKDAGDSFRVLLVKEDGSEERNLADVGFGISQLLPIILTCATVEQGSMISIEEPETNLHPRFQSLLAKLFVEAIQKFDLQVALETHSEYLLRSLQYLVALEKHEPYSIDHDKIAIVYFNNTVDHEKGVKLIQPIEITENGDIEEDYEKYWKGFYDEATTLQDKKAFANFTKIISKSNNKCLVLTEDKLINKIEILLDVSGFDLDETDVFSYRGCDNLNFALGMANSANSNPFIQKIIIHLDSDGKGKKNRARIDSYIKENKLTKVESFVTKYNDIEGYFINVDHIDEVYSDISRDRIKEVIKQVTEDVKGKSIKSIASKSGNNIELAEMAFDQNPEKYRHTKEMTPKINDTLNKATSTGSQNIIRKSQKVEIPEELKKIAKELWGK